MSCLQGGDVLLFAIDLLVQSLFLPFELGQLRFQLFVFLFDLIKFNSVVLEEFILATAVLLELSEELYFIVHFAEVILNQSVFVLTFIFVELQLFDDGLFAIDGVQMFFDLSLIEGQLERDG